MTFLKKVQTSNLLYRKFIFWIIIIILTIVSSILFFKNSKNILQNIERNSFLKDSKISDYNQKIKEIWPEDIEERVKNEIDNLKNMLNMINEAVKQGQEE